MRALGWKKDAADERDYSTTRLIMGVQAQRETPSLREYRIGRLLQGRAGSCVAQSITRAAHICEVIQSGNPDAPMPSAQFTYWAGRKQEFAGQDPATVPALDDSGMYPRLAMKATRNVGLLKAELCPYDWAKVNEELDPELLRHAYDQRGFEYHRIIVGSRVEQTRDSLLRNRPCIFGIQVDGPFMSVHDDTPISSIDGGDVRGGHMLLALEVLPNGDILFDNWWEDWGFDDGLGILSASLFESDWVDDVYAVHSVPFFTEVSP